MLIQKSRCYTANKTERHFALISDSKLMNRIIFNLTFSYVLQIVRLLLFTKTQNISLFCLVYPIQILFSLF